MSSRSSTRAAVAGSVAVIILVVSQVAQATIVMSDNQPPNYPGTSNVQYNGPQPNGPAPLIQGDLNNNPAFLVNFFGAGENLVAPSNGQARVEAADGSFNLLSIAPDAPGASFGAIDFNLHTVDNDSGSVTLTVLPAFGAPAVGTFPVDNGENRLFILALHGQRITQVNIASTVGLEDIRQVRVGDAIIPEPASVSAVTLAGGMLLLRRRR